MYKIKIDKLKQIYSEIRFFVFIYNIDKDDT